MIAGFYSESNSPKMEVPGEPRESTIEIREVNDATKDIRRALSRTGVTASPTVQKPTKLQCRAEFASRKPNVHIELISGIRGENIQHRTRNIHNGYEYTTVRK